jgi:dUTP pyrophosphatase
MSKKVKIKVKKIVPEAVIPFYAKEGDSCMDITAISENIVEESGFGYVEYGTGLSFEIPKDHTMLIFPRSSISNQGLILSNSVGVLDETYRGELKFRFKYVRGSNKYNVGDRVGQILVLPRPLMEIEEVEALSDTDRGEGGFGSTGK